MLKASFLYLLFFLSGVAGLLYQVMWMKELSLLFGSTTQSSAVTVAAFFLGLGLGAQYFGKRVNGAAGRSDKKQISPTLFYALLELAIALSALSYFLIFPLFNGLYVESFGHLVGNSTLLLLLKVLLSLVLLSIPAFFMGGTLPVMSELVVRSQNEFGKGIAGIYFINTFGACVGAIAGGFWLPEAYGFTTTYIIAVVISLSLAMLAWGFDWHLKKSEAGEINTTVKPENKKTLLLSSIVPKDILLIAAWSGMASLALQILWTRLFSQVLQNSTYTFSAILTVFLLSLTLGALLARKLASFKTSRNILATLLLLSGLLVALTPGIFMSLTNDMSYVGGKVDFVLYILEVMGVVALTIGPAVIMMGICLPYLYKLVEKDVGQQFGAVVGRINSVNTYAAIVGSLLAGFALFYWLGTWQSIYSIALLYMLAAILLFSKTQQSAWQYSAFAGTAVIIILLNPGNLPVVPFDPIKKKERVLEYWEGSAGTVAVIERNGGLKTKLNNWYALGGSKATRTESMQTHLPVNIHGGPQSVFYLGLGTGITAGAVLNYPVEKVVVAELVKEVITASDKYFAEHTNDLFDDKRVTVVNEDGRQYLQGTKELFDLIIADLFIPWRAGVSNLYAQEHYQNAITKLNIGGLYVQWIPLYQVTEKEFAVIAKTMKSVFPQVSAWRGDFYAEKPIMALIGHKSPGEMRHHRALLANSVTIANQYREKGQVPLLSHYVGQIDENLPLIQNAAINSDDKPVIEYLAPVSHRAEKQGLVTWFTDTKLLELMFRMRNPNEPYLQGLSERQLEVLYAGYFLHAAQIARYNEDEKAEEGAKANFQALMAGRASQP